MKLVNKLQVLIAASCLAASLATAQEALEIGSSIEGSISGTEFSQEYTLNVPEGTNAIVVYLHNKSTDADADLDLAIFPENADDTDFVDSSLSANGLVSIPNPDAGTYRISVENASFVGSDYTLEVNNTFPVGEDNIVTDNNLATPDSGILSANAQAQGAIKSFIEDSDFAYSYDSYAISVPQGTSNLKIELASDGDLDYYVKYGSPIVEYDLKEDGGDCDYLDESAETSATFDIANPQAGFWYVEVVNNLDEEDFYNYTVNVSSN